MHWHFLLHTLVRELDPSCWTMFTVMGVSPPFWTVPTSTRVTVLTMLMQEWDVKVIEFMVTLRTYNHWWMVIYSEQQHLSGRWPTTCGRPEWVWRQSGDLSEQCVGHSVWWFLVLHWCKGGLQTAGICHRWWWYCIFVLLCSCCFLLALERAYLVRHFMLIHELTMHSIWSCVCVIVVCL